MLLTDLLTSLPSTTSVDYHHSGTTQNITANTWTKLLNDGAGPQTNETRKPVGVGTVLDTSTSRVYFEDIPVGSILVFRVDMSVTTTISSQLDFRIFFQGRDSLGANTFSFNIDKTLTPSTNMGTPFNVLENFTFSIDGEDQRNGYLELHLNSLVSNATVTMIGLKVFYR